jgi:putative sigma-54 modulation protein
VIVRIVSRHMEVTAPIKSYAEQKAGKLTKYYDRISEIEVVLDSGKDKTTKEKIRVEMMVHVEHSNTLIAHHDVGDAYACIDACVDKLERQLTDHKEQVRNRKHQQPTDGGR